MASRVPATSHAEIIGAVASLQTQVGTLVDSVNELKGEVHRLNTAVSGHHDQIANWKRDGKWLASALVGLGAIAAFFAAVLRDWILHMVTK